MSQSRSIRLGLVPMMMLTGAAALLNGCSGSSPAAAAAAAAASGGSATSTDNTTSTSDSTLPGPAAAANLCVANHDSNTVTVYDRNAHDDVAPLRKIFGTSFNGPA